MNLMHCRPPKNAHLAIRLGFCGRLYVVDLVITAYSIPTRYYNRLETRRKHISSALMLLLLLEIKKTAMDREYYNTMKSESIYPGELYRYLQQAALTVLSMSVCLSVCLTRQHTIASVRENVCNISKNVNITFFWLFKKR